ncbi:mosc domain protein [Nannochloropsis oceanica]
MEHTKGTRVLAAAATCATGILLYVTYKGWLAICKKEEEKEEEIGKVISLYVYPVKSCKGIEVQASLVEARGLMLDRLWMVTTSTGTFRTQRQIPKMALIQPNLPSSLSAPLELNAPDMPTCVVPVWTTGKQVRVRVWDDHCQGYDQGDEVAQWLSTFLEEEDLRLVRIDDKERRQVELAFAPRGSITGFADGFPFLLANQSSLDDLNDRLPTPIPMARFRPNIVVGGPAAFDEDKWDKIAIGDIRLRVVKPCSRCKIPNTDQETAEVAKEPAETLKKFRTGAILGIGYGGKDEFYFAENLIHDSKKKTGVVSVGDPLRVFT